MKTVFLAYCFVRSERSERTGSFCAKNRRDEDSQFSRVECEWDFFFAHELSQSGSQRTQRAVRTGVKVDLSLSSSGSKLFCVPPSSFPALRPLSRRCETSAPPAATSRSARETPARARVRFSDLSEASQSSSAVLAAARSPADRADRPA